MGEEAGMDLDEIADPLIEMLADKEGRVLPFDLSISLRCLAQLGEKSPKPSRLPKEGLSMRS